MPDNTMARESETHAAGGARGPQTATASAASVLGERIAWLIRLRWFAVVGVVCVVECASRVLEIDLPRLQLYAVMIALGAYNALLGWTVKRLHRTDQRTTAVADVLARAASRVALAPVLVLICWLKAQETVLRLARAVAPGRRPPAPARKATLRDLLVPRTTTGIERDWDVFQAAAFASAQISVDLLALALLLHFSGGIENPFRYFFVFHVILSSMLLSRRATYVQATFGWLLMTAVGLGEAAGALDHHPLAGFGATGAYRDPAYLAAQLAVLGITLGLSAYMAGDTAARLRRREREAILLGRQLTRNAALLESAYESLRSTEQAKSRYMRKVAHELRGPLGTIQTALRTVLDGVSGTIADGPRDLVGRAERRAADLALVTTDLLALSQARDGALSVARVPVDLAALAAETVSDLDEAARSAGIDLRLDVGAAGELIVEGDPIGLRELLRNLVSNAIRYTPPGGQVRVMLAGDGGAVALTVHDSGIGISPEDLPRIFEEFFRSAAARQRCAEGTGLGLAIVKAVVDKHAGTISAQSEPGQGSTFRVVLPRCALAHQPTQGSSQTHDGG